MEEPMPRRTTTSLEDIAAEVGRLFGTTENHAKNWLSQRKALLSTLHTVRERATSLINDLSGETDRQLKRMAKVRIARTQTPDGNPVELLQGRKKRRTSAATRAKMRLAAKKRWAKKKGTPI
jgi:hypothetical protein